MCRRHHTISLLTVYALVKESTESVMVYSTIESKNPKNRKLFRIYKEGPKGGVEPPWRDLSFFADFGFVNREIWLFFLQKRKAFPLCARNKVLSKKQDFAKISNGIITQSEYDYVEVRG